MALTSAQQWWVRAGGNELNGGGYDASIASPGTNYADQDAAQVTFNGTTVTATTSGVSTTIAITGYTVATTDVANILRIASGTNFIAGYYAIVSVNTGLGTWTLDRNCTSGVGAALVGRMGGAHPSLINMASGGTATNPALTSPFAAGHTINIRGGGTDDPAVGSPDYTQTGYYTFSNGSLTVGAIRILGYNGRPYIQGNGEIIHQVSYLHLKTLKFSTSAATTASTVTGASAAPGGVMCEDLIIDQNGQDQAFCDTLGHAVDCWFKNTGSTSAGTKATVTVALHGGFVTGCRLENQRGWAINAGQLGGVVNNTITNCRLTTKGGIDLDFSNNTTPIGILVMNNTLEGNQGDGIRIGTGNNGACWSAEIFDNLCTNNVGYGLNAPSGADRFFGVRPDFNAFYNNTAGARNNVSAGDHDVTLTADPYTNAAGADYTLNTTAGGGAACRGAGILLPGTATVGSRFDIGALQHLAA